jgi:hypothetical protein
MGIKCAFLFSTVFLIVLNISAQKVKPHPSLFVESGLNTTRYEVSVSTVGSDEQPKLRTAIGNYAKAGVLLPFNSCFNGSILIGYSSERISSEVRKTVSTGGGTLTYPYEVNALQHLADIETKLLLSFPINNGIRIQPSIGIGSSIGLTKNSNNYSYLIPGVQLMFKRAGLNASYKLAHYNVEAAQNEEWFQVTPKQFLIRPRILQLGFTYLLKPNNQSVN